MSGPSIKEIAAKAGVSVSTVSKVLNNKSDVGPVTRQRVLEIVRSEGYRRRVSAVKGRIVGIFFPFGNGVRLSNPYTSGIVFSAADALIQSDYRIELISTHSIPREKFAFLRYCTESNIEAAIFVLATTEDRYIAELAEALPVVATGASFESSNLTTICYDAYGAARDAVRHLADLGHRRIAFVCEDQRHRDQRLRYQGFRDELTELNPNYEPPTLLNAREVDRTDIRRFLEHTWQSKSVPSALLVSNDMAAAHVLEHLRSLGLRVPDDVSLVGFDDLPFSRYMQPALTTVQQPIQEIGSLAAEEVQRLILGDTTNLGREIVLDGNLLVRDSTRPPA